MTTSDAWRPQITDDASVLLTSIRTSALSVCRFAADIPENESVDVTAPADDAFVVLYQLRDHPAHEFCLDGRIHEVGATPSRTLHVIDVAGGPRARFSEPVDSLMFHLPRAALDEIAEDAGASKIERLIAPEAWRTTDAVVDSLHGFIVEALAGGNPVNRLFYDHLLCGLGAHFAATYGGMRPRRLTRGGLAPWQQRRAEELIVANLGGGLSLDAIAQECGLSPAYFARAFKRSVRKTPHAWLQERRVDHAKRLLIDRDLPLAEVALRCGFADQSHFTRSFARLAGVTPGAWRRAALTGNSTVTE